VEREKWREEREERRKKIKKRNINFICDPDSYQEREWKNTEKLN